MDQAFEGAVLRIRSQGGQVVGAGFVVAPGRALTCAHVASSALNLREGESAEGRAVPLDFPLLEPERSLLGRVVLWRGEEDIAGLALEGELPAGVGAAPMAWLNDLWGHQLRVFGFPAGFEMGVWARGELLGRNAAGWVQVEAVRQTGHFIRPGYSGGPVWDEALERVVGMVVAADAEAGTRAAFIIPARTLAQAWPGLALIQTTAALGALYNVPELPPHFMPRPEALDRLRQLVLGEAEGPVVLTGRARRVGVHGMGGIGKTVLAAALARDQALRQAFPDGIYWLTLGREPILTTLQSQLARSLGGAESHIDDPQGGRALLRELLAGRRCLLVLDDVWRAEHAAALEVVDLPGRLLVTTRDAGLIASLGAVEQRLEVLDEESALALLAEWAGQPREALPAEARQVARECGMLPLALSMVGATVRGRPERWGRALARLQSADLDKIQQQFPHYAYPDLLRAIQVSVEELEPEAQARYRELAVYPEDTPIPEASLRVYWAPAGLARYDVEDLVDLLVDRSLARREAAQDGALTLHDLQHDYLRWQAADLRGLHERLLAAYQQHCPEGWASGPDDGYYYQQLAYHLREAGRWEALAALLTGSPDWMRRKYEVCRGDASTMADLDLALAGLEALPQPLPPERLAALIRLQSARQVIRQRAGRFADADLRTLVLLGRSEEALNQARLRGEPGDRCAGLLTIYHALLESGGEVSEGLLEEVVGAARVIPPGGRRDFSLRSLAAVLAQADRFEKARAVAEEVQDPALKAYALRDLARALVDAGRAPEARAAAEGIEDRRMRTEALLALAGSLDRAGSEEEARVTYEQARQVARETLSPERQAAGLRKVAAALAGSGRSEAADAVFQEAQAACAAIGPEQARLQAWGELGAAQVEAGREQAAETCFAQAREAIAAIHLGPRYAAAHQVLAVALMRAGREAEAVAHFEEACAAAAGISPAKQRVKALRLLGEALAGAGQQEAAGEVLAQAGQAAGEIDSQAGRAAALHQVSSALARVGFFAEAGRLARTIEQADRRASALRELEVTLVRAGRHQEAAETMQEVGEAASADLSQIRFALALAELGAALLRVGRPAEGEQLLQAALLTGRSLGQGGQRKAGLDRLATALIESGRLSQALEVLEWLDELGGQQRVLQALVPALLARESRQEQEALLEEIRRLAGRAWWGIHKSVLLRSVGTVLARLGRKREAREYFDWAANAAQDHYWYPDQVTWALFELAVAIREAGMKAEGDKILDRVRNFALTGEASDRDFPVYADYRLELGDLARLGAAMMGAGWEETAGELLALAEGEAREQESADRRAAGLIQVALAWDQAGRRGEAERLLAEAEALLAALWERLGRPVHQAGGPAVESSAAWGDWLEGQVRLAAALAQLGELERAQNLLEALPRCWQADAAWLALGQAWLKAGGYEQARKAARCMVEPKNTDPIYRELARRLPKDGRHQEGREAAGKISEEGVRSAALAEIAAGLAHEGRYREALAALGPRESSDYLAALAGWAPAWEAMGAGMGAELLLAAIRITGWARPDWASIAQDLGLAEGYE